MSERKEDEEMVDQGSTESSESEHMVDTHVQLEDSPQQEHQSEIPSGNSDSTRSDDGDRNHDSDRFVESAEAVQFNAQEVHLSNGDASSPFKSTVDGVNGEGESKAMLKEGSDYLEVNGCLVQPEGEKEQVTVVDTKGGVENVEELKKLEESNNSEEVKNVEESVIVEEPKYVKEPLPKVTVESKDAGGLKVEVNAVVENPGLQENGVKEQHLVKQESAVVPYSISTEGFNQSFPSSLHMVDGDDSGTEEEQAAFTRELESFFRERSLEFKHPKFYGEGLNCLKLWRAVTRLGGYDRVTACKLWRQVGESFHPPKTCTTVSWSFRIFYEKALLDYERHKTRGGELVIPASPLPETLGIENHMGSHQGSGSGRARRDAAARAMQGWHSQRLLGNGEVGDPIIKDKNALSTPKREKQLKSLGMLKRKKPTIMDRSVKALRTITKSSKPQIHTDIVDDGPAADWVKINVRRTKDCFEVYALVPGLLREEVRVQSDPAGRLVISGDPEQPDNPWGVTPFRKVISLPSRIDPHQTSAVVTLHGQLFVRVPFEQSDL